MPGALLPLGARGCGCCLPVLEKTGTNYTGTGLAQGLMALSPPLGATCVSANVEPQFRAQRQGAWSPLLERRWAEFSWTPPSSLFLLPSVNIQGYVPLASYGTRDQNKPPGTPRHEGRIPPDEALGIMAAQNREGGWDLVRELREGVPADPRTREE